MVADVPISNDGPGQVAHDLMHLDQDAAGTVRAEGGRLNVRVDLGPLLRPVGADLLIAAGEAPP